MKKKKPVKKPAANTKANLTKANFGAKVQDVTTIVVNQAKKMKLSAYGLAKLTGITEQSLRNFMAGKHHMRSDKLADLLAVLEIRLVTKAEWDRLKEYEFRYKGLCK